VSITHVRLYSIQPRFIYDALCKDGRFLPRPMEAGDQWEQADTPHGRAAYEWLCGEMEARGLSRPDPEAYPVWAWQQFRGVRNPKPDLRTVRHWCASGREVLLTLEVPAAQVLLHDYDAWHYPLNHWYLGPQKASALFERRCEVAGFPLHSGAPCGDPGLRAELEKSWQTIFDLKAVRRLMLQSAADQVVQATFWELRAEHVLEAVEFGHRRPRLRLALPGRSRTMQKTSAT